ncbi:tetratricopeptide repeat protein [Solidesulfovibrio sp. C21]|uniref:tetratricopeptide repeat protein n=1 Tax=Solidesulfovibrio sp. C21 TaxID=3398613 RepID=UPI0039FCBCD5
MRVHWFHYLAFIAVLMLAGGVPCQAVNADGGQGEVGYSTGTDEPSASGMSPAESSSKVASEKAVRDAKPEISITLDNLESLPPETAPATPPPVTPQRAMVPSPPARVEPPAAAVPSFRQNVPSGAAAPASASPIVAMLENTLHGRYDATIALKERMPKKVFHETYDRAAANVLSRKGNMLLNQQGDMAGALEAYAAAYAKDKSSSEINGSYGHALFRNGRFTQARDTEIESLEIKPGYGAAWFVLGQIFGYLKQEDYAYASFVNTCLFTRNMDNTLGFLDREKDKYGEVCVQRAAARALETCRNLAARGIPPSGEGRSAPQPARMAPPGSSAPRIGKVDIKKVVLDSNQLPQLVGRLARMEGISRQEREQRLKAMVVPMVTAIRALVSRYAREHGYAVVLPAEGEVPFRQQGSLGPQAFSLVGVDGTALRFLNSPEGIRYRKTAAIDDLTQAVSQRFNSR